MELTLGFIRRGHAPAGTPMAVEVWSFSPEEEEAERLSYQSVLDSAVARCVMPAVTSQGELATGTPSTRIVRVAKVFTPSDRGRSIGILRVGPRPGGGARFPKSLIEHAP